MMKAQSVTAWFALIVREMVSRDLLKKVEQVCILLETKKNLILVFANCIDSGAVLCSQCKGSGVNSEDLFSGTFKAGDSCWLCG